MLAIAVGGLAINIASLLILRAGKGENLNVRGAWLHVMSDALGSVGAITAAILIWAFGWTWADSLASVAIGLMVIYSSGSLLREALGVLMEGAPAHIDVEEVRRAMGEHRAVIERPTTSTSGRWEAGWFHSRVTSSHRKVAITDRCCEKSLTCSSRASELRMPRSRSSPRTSRNPAPRHCD